MDGEKKFILEFLKVYQTLTSLWDTSCQEYTNKQIKHDQYLKLLEKYREFFRNAELHEMKKKINTLRTNYRRALKELTKYNLDENAITLYYFKELDFLRKCEIPQRSKSFNSSSNSSMTVLDEIEVEIDSSSSVQFKTEMSLEEMDMYGDDSMSSNDLCKSNPNIEKVNVADTTDTITAPIKSGKTKPKYRKLEMSLIPEATITNISSKFLTPRTKKYKPIQSMSPIVAESNSSQGYGDMSDGQRTSNESEAMNENLIEFQTADKYKIKDNFDRIAETWAEKLRGMDPIQQLWAEKFINDIMLEGQLGTLHRHSVQIMYDRPKTIVHGENYEMLE
ncbi:uncharacterized protein [Musca autumnalis]|uniref:uncharacterized protein n=1 Tax=Musca autumnalis TaxID=221902 RepID=UPI003CE95750